MSIKKFGIRALASVWSICAVLAFTPADAQETVEANAAAIDACAQVINPHFDQVYPKSSRFVWDMSRLTVEESLFGALVKGGGDYRGKGGKRRTFDFDCSYDPYEGQVVKASWESSHEPGVVRLVVDVTEGMEILPGAVLEACTGALDARILETWPRYQKLELLDETMDRRKTRDGYLLRGEGRFLGVADAWHRYDFRCMFDGESADLTWKHHGKEVEE